MAIQLSKPIKRQLMSTDRKGRPLIVTLEPGDILSFRPKGAKRTTHVHISQCAILAQMLEVNREYEARLTKYKSDRAIGLKRRKPNKPFLPFGKIYFDSLK